MKTLGLFRDSRKKEKRISQKKVFASFLRTNSEDRNVVAKELNKRNAEDAFAMSPPPINEAEEDKEENHKRVTFDNDLNNSDSDSDDMSPTTASLKTHTGDKSAGGGKGGKRHQHFDEYSSDRFRQNARGRRQQQHFQNQHHHHRRKNRFEFDEQDKDGRFKKGLLETPTQVQQSSEVSWLFRN